MPSDTAQPCFEIVNFKFVAGTPADVQLAHLRRIGEWAERQTGFIERRSFHEAAGDRWVDLVSWKDEACALGAMKAIGSEPSLAPVMSAIDAAHVSMGHFRRLL